MLRGLDSATLEAAPTPDGSIQEFGATSSNAIVALARDLSWRDHIASLNQEHHSAYQRAIDRAETRWAEEFKNGLLTPLAYYRRLRRIPLDCLAFRTGISVSELFVLDDG